MFKINTLSGGQQGRRGGGGFGCRSLERNAKITDSWGNWEQLQTTGDRKVSGCISAAQ